MINTTIQLRTQKRLGPSDNSQTRNLYLVQIRCFYWRSRGIKRILRRANEYRQNGQSVRKFEPNKTDRGTRSDQIT
ncbi:hypothetical protein Smp_133340 [Schistosoma mansoni]|uniref:Uncharacterized protein n=1 Tax=Schistosoma mansoni TaxID=6183 RepID=G4LY89_SCHMA|nr:hypothetical protein Smp_133340 [Schistosoma mansoni]|eukprot:XP_018646227.1 hypothetical protein Smp_133340 [Schistosoma mansoni]